MRKELQERYSSFSGCAEDLPMKRILRELGKYFERTAGSGSPDPGYELLQARCNIFEALLIKYFRPAGQFEDLVMK